MSINIKPANQHWTPRSGFFPCAAKISCPKSQEHFGTYKKSNEDLKANYNKGVEAAKTALQNQEIDGEQYVKVVNQLKAKTSAAMEKNRGKATRKIFSTRLTKTVSTVVAGATLLGALTACGATVAEMPEKSNDPSHSQQQLENLTDADKINLNKALISWGDNWEVSADGAKFGEIKGQAIKVLGDTYTMYDNEGVVLATEAEKSLTLLNSASTYDHQNEERGSIQKEISLVFAEYTIKDANENAIGTASQKFGISLNLEVKDKTGEVEYVVNKAVFSWGASLDIEKKVDKPDVPVEDAIWVSVIANEIDEKQKEDSDRRNK